jgi:hypothetical protein
MIAAAGDPGMILGRPRQVSIWSPGMGVGERLAVLAQHGMRGLGIFFWRGDTIPRHNLPGRPIFDLLVAPFFVVGTVWAARHWRRPAAMLALLWSAAMLVPTILAEDTPHFLRAVGLLPFVLLLAALGLERVRQLVAHRAATNWLPGALLGIILAGSLGWTTHDYFGRYAADARTAYAFQEAATELAARLNQASGPVWASERFRREWESIPFLVTAEVHWIPDGAVPQGLGSLGGLFLWPYGPVAPVLNALPPRIRLTGWRGPLTKGDLESEPYPLYWGYRLTPASAPAEPVACFSGGICLMAAAATQGADGVWVDLVWTTATPVDRDYLVFAHLVDQTGLVDQADGPPAAGTLPTSWWRPGDQIVDRRLIEVPPTDVADRPQVVLGLYRSDNGDRLSVIDAAGQPQGDSITLALIGSTGD